MAGKINSKTKTLAIFVLILVALIALCVMTTVNANRYANEDKTWVSAQVTEIEYYNHTDADSSTTDEGYYIYIDYSAAGTNFDHVLYASVSDYKTYSEGQLLDVEVFSETGELASDTAGFSIFLIIGTVIYALGGGFYVLRKIAR